MAARLERNGRPGHEPAEDTLTGGEFSAIPLTPEALEQALDAGPGAEIGAHAMVPENSEQGKDD